MRLPEKTEKLALLYAISENPGNPIKNLHIDAETFTRTLEMCDQIEEEMVSRRKTIIMLNTAA